MERQQTKFEIIYITNLPSFYKIKLFNEINKRKNLLVIFTHRTSDQRNEDFYSGDLKFKFLSIADKSKLSKMFFVMHLLYGISYRQIIIGGWEQIEYWLIALLSSKKKNSVVVESSIFDSNTMGIKGLLKKIFLSRISKAYVSGESQNKLCKQLGFNGNLIVTKGVGIFNIVTQPQYKPSLVVQNFIFVGRLSYEKNLKYLIETFNELPNLNLSIVGFGPHEQFLKSIAHKNIVFLGAIPNSKLFKFYQQNDVFILPSISEPWGMVVEEALNNGLPVIVSNKVGCAEEIVNESNGLIFQLSDPEGLKNAIIQIQEISYYNGLRRNISKLNFQEIAENQIKCYI